MGFYDGKGIYRTAGDNFFDSEGIMRGPNDNFFDGKGIIRGPNDNFFDSEGIMRGPNDLFFDSTGTLGGPKSKASSSSYYDRDTGGGGVSSSIFADIVSFLFLGAIGLLVAALAGYCIFGMWYFMFNAMTSSGSEGYFATGIIFASIIITSIVTYIRDGDYIESVVSFYIINSVIIYVGININGIIFGDFGLSSILGGAFITLCLSVLPSLIMPGIIFILDYIIISIKDKYVKRIDKILQKEPDYKLMKKMYKTDRKFYKVMNKYAESPQNKYSDIKKVSLKDAYNESKNVRVQIYKYMKKHNMLK